MKKNGIGVATICFLVSVVVFTSCQSPSSSQLTESDKQFIRDANKTAQDEWNRGERNGYINRYSEDAVVMPGNSDAFVGKAAIANFAKSYPDVKVYFADEEIIGMGDYAYVRGPYKITDQADAFLDKGKFVSFWKKQSDGKWLLIRDMFNSDLPVAAAQTKTE